MNVLYEILEWSRVRPVWQRDALRRLVLKGELNDVDISALTEVCKSARGLVSVQEAIPFGRKHLPRDGESGGRVNVHSIYHKYGVNALAEDQTLRFCSGLTLVYGDNAAGKSGYIRIFKSACRARGAEDILGNVLAGTAPKSPRVSIKYRVGEESPSEWSGGDDEAIARVSVFDRHSEAVYTTQKTDVAFRPFGLDLFDKLADACSLVRSQLEHEKRSLSVSAIQGLNLPRNTNAAKFVAGLSLLTSPDDVKAVGNLTEGELNRLSFIEKQLLDSQANDPSRLEQELTLRSRRLRVLSQRLRKLHIDLSLQAIRRIFKARSELQSKEEEARNLREKLDRSNLLPGTGSNDWNVMWEAGRQFSENNAYPDKPFPVTDDGALCVLCQQHLDTASSERLTRFEEFITSTTERDARTAKDEFERLLRDFENLTVSNSETEDSLRDIRIEDEKLALAVTNDLSLAEQRRVTILRALATGTHPDGFEELPSNATDVEMLADQLAERAEGLRQGTSKSQREALAAELEEMRARQTLQKHEKALLLEIERLKKIAAYEQCIKDTSTRSISIKSANITKVVVTQQLKAAFQEELEKLNFRHVEVELEEAGGQTGNFYHKLILTRAPGVELPKVVSEGESRCLSIAAFFAELSTADDPSAILFDDPVSSFDYKWRESVARRLVDEAKRRQVIVFTHDIVFLHRLREYGEQENVEMLDQHVRQLGIGAGVCEERLPWVAMRVNKRISFLNDSFQEAEKLFRLGKYADYETRAAQLYGYLREAWERGLEEVLLEGIVERFRPSIQTQQIGKIADISPADCKAVEVAMTKCSKWLAGHDQAPPARQDVPEPHELQQDIGELDSWVRAIRKRRRR